MHKDKQRLNKQECTKDMFPYSACVKFLDMLQSCEMALYQT